MNEFARMTRNTWLAVEFWDASTGQFIGHDAFSFSAWGRRPHWENHPIVAVRIIGYGNREACMAMIAAAGGRIVRAVTTVDGGPMHKPVRCSNGRDYASAAEACAQLGIDRSNMRKHLLGHAGYRTVKGLQFMHITVDDMGESR